jgi:hypothetical protein
MQRKRNRNHVVGRPMRQGRFLSKEAVKSFARVVTGLCGSNAVSNIFRMELTTVLTLIIISAVILAVLGILLVLLTHKTSSPTQHPIFRPLTGVNQAGRPHSTGKDARKVQFFPVPSPPTAGIRDRPPSAVGMRAAVERRANGQSQLFTDASSPSPNCSTKTVPARQDNSLIVDGGYDRAIEHFRARREAVRAAVSRWGIRRLSGM